MAVILFYVPTVVFLIYWKINFQILFSLQININ